MPRHYIRKYTAARACRDLLITERELQAVLRAAEAVCSEIAPDLAGVYKDGNIPRYDMIECVCDCDRLINAVARNGRWCTNHLPADMRSDATAIRLREAPREVLYGVVGMALSSQWYCY